MKKYILYPISVIVLVMLAMGCSEEFLDRQPLDTEVSTNFYRTEADALMALTAAYDALGWDQMPGVSWAPFCTVSDMLSDDSFAGGSDANDGMDENELNTYNIPTTNLLVKATWMKNYVGIYRSNLLMEKMDQITMAEEKKARMIGECKFLRAYYHFELVRFFENIPLLTATIKGPSEYNQDQETPKEVYDQIALDLVERTFPDVVFLDVMMPEMDGIEALQYFQERHPRIKVIMITGNPSVENVQESIQGGAAGFIVKPFNTARVLDTLHKALQGAEKIAQ